MTQMWKWTAFWDGRVAISFLPIWPCFRNFSFSIMNVLEEKSSQPLRNSFPPFIIYHFLWEFSKFRENPPLGMWINFGDCFHQKSWKFRVPKPGERARSEIQTWHRPPEPLIQPHTLHCKWSNTFNTASFHMKAQMYWRLTSKYQISIYRSWNMQAN